MHVGVSELSIGVNEIGLQLEENGWMNKRKGLFVQTLKWEFNWSSKGKKIFTAGIFALVLSPQASQETGTALTANHT